MASMALEQMLSSVNGIREENTLTINIYTNGVSQMYTGPMGPPSGIGGFGGPGGFGGGDDFRRNEFNQKVTENNYEESFSANGTFNPTELQNIQIFDFPNSGGQVHLHHNDLGISGGRLYDYSRDNFKPLNAYEASMFDYRAKQLDIKPIKITLNKW